MKLSHIIGKSVYAGSKRRGTCQGVGVSLKNGAVKYLLCSAAGGRTDFCVNVSAIEELDDEIYLSRLRPSFPKNAAIVSAGLPVYTGEGTFLGNVTDLEMQDFIALRVETDKNERLPFSSVAACTDAILLRKKQPYPIGQRIPAPILSEIFQKNEPLVNRATLREAIKKGALIKLTLSLAPFEY
ncbi:MAG: PRC-barrel domain-containing protein [Clostridia bacterium]|nr:PRC-barrel domain-containing protein [Clostridia bacterium]